MSPPNMRLRLTARVDALAAQLYPLGSAAGRDVRAAAPRNLFTECTEAPVELCGIVPERGMTCVRHDVNLRVR